MASERSRAIRDLDRASEHFRKAYNLIAWIGPTYIDLPEIAHMSELIREASECCAGLVDDIVTLINGGTLTPPEGTKDGDPDPGISESSEG